MNQSIENILKEMDGVFEGFFAWLEGQYDEATGGFFYARSSKESGSFTPDIESTSQAVNIMERCGILEKLSPERKERMVRFYQAKQDPTSGNFYDEDPNMRLDDVMVGRAIGYSLHSMAKLGGAPLYPLSKERQASPAYMRSSKAYGEWLRSISLANSWRGCDRLCNSAPYLGQLTIEEREPFLKEAFDYFDSIQDRHTGLWGEGGWYVRISGTFKLHTFYNRFQIPLPRVNEMYQSIKFTLRNDDAKDMCYIRNPINLLSSMKLKVPSEDMREMAEITLANMIRLKQRDGGFSRELAHSPIAPNVAQVKAGEFYPEMPIAVPLGLGLAEGDMNAGTQAILIRWLCHELAGLQPKPLPVFTHLFE